MLKQIDGILPTDIINELLTKYPNAKRYLILDFEIQPPRYRTQTTRQEADRLGKNYIPEGDIDEETITILRKVFDKPITRRLFIATPTGEYHIISQRKGRKRTRIYMTDEEKLERLQKHRISARESMRRLNERRKRIENELYDQTKEMFLFKEGVK